MTPSDRQQLQQFIKFCAVPLIAPAAILGFLWQFVEYGWVLGNIGFNRLFEKSGPADR